VKAIKAKMTVRHRVAYIIRIEVCGVLEIGLGQFQLSFNFISNAFQQHAKNLADDLARGWW
jgi:hypothetical protein